MVETTADRIPETPLKPDEVQTDIWTRGNIELTSGLVTVENHFNSHCLINKPRYSGNTKS